jgi:uncharacterized protein (TIGR00255 family)
MTIRSMTGYARIRRETAEGEVILSIKSVNHRGLDIHFHLPPEFESYEHSLRNVIRRLIGRGHLEVRATFKRTSESQASALNEPLLDSFVAAWRAAAKRHGIDAPPDLATALRLPGVFASEVDADPSAVLENALCAIAEEVCQELNRFREREGAETLAVLLDRADQIRMAAAQVREIRTRALPAFQARLRERLAELLGGSSLDPQRLVQEAAMLADRSDIGEEITRLEIHVNQLVKLLRDGGEVGKKLDFLLQEMNRETNTMLSKTNGIGEQGVTLTETALRVKADIEKIREQSLNVE